MLNTFVGVSNSIYRQVTFLLLFLRTKSIEFTSACICGVHTVLPDDMLDTGYKSDMHLYPLRSSQTGRWYKYEKKKLINKKHHSKCEDSVSRYVEMTQMRKQSLLFGKRKEKLRWSNIWPGPRVFVLKSVLFCFTGSRMQ